MTQLTTVDETVSPLSSEQLKSALEEEQKKRNLLNEYIDTNLVEKSDYDLAFPSAKKPSLLKPGSEKIISLLNLEAAFEADHETLQMLSDDNKGKTVCYICHLISRATSRKVAEGRGAYTMGEKDGRQKSDISHNVNTAIKMAQKRAQVDATMRIAALSDRFTQDSAPKPSGTDQTDEVIDALRACKTLKTYKEIASNFNEGKYTVQEAARPKVMEFFSKTQRRLLTVKDADCKCTKESKEPCDVCKEDIQQSEKEKAPEPKEDES